MRRSPVSDHNEDYLDDDGEAAIQRISTSPSEEGSSVRGDPRYWRGSRWQQRPPRRRRPDPKGWLLRVVLGLCALAAIWFILQYFFPLADQQPPEAQIPTQAPAPPQAVAPEPATTSVAEQPVAAQPAAPAESQPTLVPQPTVAPEERLPGLATPAPQAAAEAPPSEAPPAAEAEAPAEPAAEDAPAGPPTIAPIPPPEGPAGPVANAPAPAPPPARAAPPAPPPGPRGSSGSLTLQASASPSNPVSENAMVTINVNVTSNGAPVAGASCISTVYFRTATVRQPSGGATTNSRGAASFVIDAKGATYGRYIPVDVTCSTRSGSVSARTGFTPVRGR